MTRALVAEYALIYEPGYTVELCDPCADSLDHECGALGAAVRGKVRGECEGKRHQGRLRCGLERRRGA
jgi:hypothetical protein